MLWARVCARIRAEVRLTTSARHVRRFLLTAALVGAAMAAAAAPAFAIKPARDDTIAAARPAKPPGRRRRQAEDPRLRHLLPAVRARLPDQLAFAIVGVNGGRVFSANPCLADELRWGGDAAAEVYINTGNPGPALSSFWPLGQTTPRVCAAANPDTADCAYDYGWNAAQHSYQTLESAPTPRAGSPPTRTPRPGGSTSRPRTAGATTPRSTSRHSRARSTTCDRAA